MHIRFLKIGFSTVFLAIAAGTSLPAAAIKTGSRCYSPQEINQIMKDEGQQLVVAANEVRPGLGPEALHDEVRLFYMNPTTRKGYLVKGDGTWGTLEKSAIPTKCAEIWEEFEKAKLFDASIPGLDPAARLEGDITIADRQCDYVNSKDKDYKTCLGYHNNVLERAEHNDLHVYFQAYTTEQTSLGQSPVLVTVAGERLGEPSEGRIAPGGVILTGGIFWTTPAGAIINEWPYTLVTYAPKGLELLRQRQR